MISTKYYSSDEMRIVWAGHIALWRRVACRVLAEKLEGKRSPGRSRHRFENNIKLDLQEWVWKEHGLD
jgi:hypothetical protein